VKKFVTLFIAIILFASCHKTTKVVEETYTDGSPKIERYYKGEGADKEMVKEVKYYQNKQKEMEGEFKNSKRDGYWVAYYENGNKWSEGYFENGLDHGKRTVYYENGKKRYEGNYTKGVQTGKWQFWSESGLLEKEVDYDKK
jgi:antitoxin component YwqK of YwqJK toxin-antitoxin module